MGGLHRDGVGLRVNGFERYVHPGARDFIQGDHERFLVGTEFRQFGHTVERHCDGHRLLEGILHRHQVNDPVLFCDPAGFPSGV